MPKFVIPLDLVLTHTDSLRLVNVDRTVPLIRTEPDPELSVNYLRIHGVLGQGRAQVARAGDGDFPEGQHGLQINEGESTQIKAGDRRHATAEHQRSFTVLSAVAVIDQDSRAVGDGMVTEEFTVLVIHEEGRGRDVLLGRREARERRKSAREVLQRPRRGVARAPVQGYQIVGDGVVQDVAAVIGRAEQADLLQCQRVDARDRGRGVGPVLRDRDPDVSAVVVDAAAVILDVSGLGESSIGDALPFLVVYQHVREAGTRRPVGAIDRLVEGHRGHRPLAGGDEESIIADANHALGLSGVAFQLDFGDERPCCRPTQSLE